VVCYLTEFLLPSQLEESGGNIAECSRLGRTIASTAQTLLQTEPASKQRENNMQKENESTKTKTSHLQQTIKK
jgi:hypothetical protein